MGYYREIKGDLLELFDIGVFDAMGHGANCFNRMRSGIAGQISKKFPEAVEADNKTIPGDKSKLGNFTYWEHPSGARFYNLYTQYNYGREENHTYLDYYALESAFMNMKLHLKNHSLFDDKILDIGFPKIGCGLAQGDWNRVKALIQLTFDDHNITIVNYAQMPKINSKKLF